MDNRKITIGNATYYVSRQFADNRTVQDAIRESIALHTQEWKSQDYISARFSKSEVSAGMLKC